MTEVLVGALGAKLVVVGVGLPLRAQPPRERRAAREDGGEARFRGGRGDARGGSRRRPRLVDEDPRAARRGPRGRGGRELLGRYHELRGTVEPGDARGGPELGFPTANVAVPAGMALPSEGIYAGWYVRDDGSRHRAAVSLGHRPTFHPEGSPAAARGVPARLRGRPVRRAGQGERSSSGFATSSGSTRWTT